MITKGIYENSFFEAVSQTLKDYTETVEELDGARSKGKDEYKRVCDLFKLDELTSILKMVLIPKDKELRKILLHLRKAMESECKFRELDLKIQWGLASRLEVAKAAYYVTLSTECMEEFNKSFKKKFN